MTVLERRKREFGLVESKYGPVEIGPDLDWLIIKRHPLPAGWNRDETPILVMIRPGYPTVPPDNFYVAGDLRLANGQMPGNAPNVQEHLGRSWLMFSYHVEEPEWKPQADLFAGHNLLTFLLGVEKRLSEVN